MTKDTTYNGWTNYETWAVKLWIDNEQGSHEHAREMAREAWSTAQYGEYATKSQAARLALADSLKAEYEEASADVLERAGATSSVWADLLGAALESVNWLEIAGNLLGDLELDGYAPRAE